MPVSTLTFCVGEPSALAKVVETKKKSIKPCNGLLMRGGSNTIYISTFFFIQVICRTESSKGRGLEVCPDDCHSYNQLGKLGKNLIFRSFRCQISNRKLYLNRPTCPFIGGG